MSEVSVPSSPYSTDPVSGSNVPPAPAVTGNLSGGPEKPLNFKERISSMTTTRKVLLYSALSFLLVFLMFGLAWFGWRIFSSRQEVDFLVGYQGVAAQDPLLANEGELVTSPLNGEQYSPQEALSWQQRRPLAVMINNHEVSRPVQAGVSYADIVYEAVAEGGISRLLAIFHSKLPEKVGTVRSARVYYIDWAREYDAWYAHHGRAQIDPNDPFVCHPSADAFNRMQQIFVSSIEGVNSCWRESSGLPYEHTLYCDPQGLLSEAYQLYPDQRRNFDSSLVASWKFKDDSPVAPASAVSSVKFNFWDTRGYNVEWKYSPDKNAYLRWQAGLEHKDILTGSQLEAKTVIIQFMRETELNDLKVHLLYDTVGEGPARIFVDGRVIKATWSRPDISLRTKYVDEEGEEIEFNRGQVWIEVLPLGMEVTYL